MYHRDRPDLLVFDRCYPALPGCLSYAIVDDMGALAENLVRLRTARGWRQEDLARASGVSEDTISKIERGEVTRPRALTLQALCGALTIPIERLTGRVSPEQDTAGAHLLRRAVQALDIPEGNETPDVLPLAELHTAASGAWKDYIAGRHAEMLAGLPTLMTDVRRTAESVVDDHRAEAAGLLAMSYRLAAGLAGRIGLVDLAAHSAQRALDTARHTNRPDLDEVAAKRYFVWVLIRQGEWEAAERLALTTAEKLDTQSGLMSRPDPDRLSMFGALMCNAAAAAGRIGSTARAEDHLAIASAAAARAGRDRTDEASVMFGPRSTAIQTVEVAVRSGRPDDAVRLARTVPDPRGQVPVFWEAAHRVHLAAACADLGDWPDALGHLAAAADISPQWSQRQPLGRAVAEQVTEHRRRSELLTKVTEHYGAS